MDPGRRGRRADLLTGEVGSSGAQILKLGIAGHIIGHGDGVDMRLDERMSYHAVDELTLIVDPRMDLLQSFHIFFSCFHLMLLLKLSENYFKQNISV